jgi:LacI family transcriptional regulator
MVDIHEIARRAKVSIATVSRAMNNPELVREETRQRVLKIAQELDYIPNPVARGLSKRQTDTIGVILPELMDEFFMRIIHSIDEEAYKNNRYVMVSSSHSERNIVATLMEFMGSGRVDGVIVMAPLINDVLPNIIRKSRRPVVMLNNIKDMDDVVRFYINNYRGAFSITEHLIEHGYKNIGIIQGPEGNCEAEERFLGFKDALLKNKLSIQDSFFVPGGFTEKSGYYGFTRLMNQNRKPEAIFAANDMMAVGAYKAAMSLKIRIPKDVAIVGFDNIYLSTFLVPRLTTVHVPVIELGTKAVRYLIQMINKEVDPEIRHHEEISTGLVIGGSCGCENSII